MPGASLIICSRNRPALLKECVESVLHGDQVPEELIVVDDSDAEHEWLATVSTERPCEVRYFWRRGTGLSSASNFAMRQATHELFVFTQDDAVVDPDWFSTILRALLEAGPRTVVTGQVAPGVAETAGAFVSAMKVMPQRVVYDERPDHDILFALNMALHRSTAEEIGPFDERLGPGTPFPGSEDSDFALRALEAGVRIVYEPAAIVRHRAWRGEEAHMGFRWGYGFARGGFYAKHLSLRDRYMMRRLWCDLRDHLAPLPRLALSDRQTARGHLALSGGIIAGALTWMVTQGDRRTNRMSAVE